MVALLKEAHVPLLPTAGQVRLTEARDEEGRSLLLPSVFGSVHLGVEGVGMGTMQLRLRPPARSKVNAKIRVLRGVLPLEVMVRQQGLAVVPDLGQARGHTVRGVRGHRLTLEAVRQQGNFLSLQIRLSGPPGWQYEAQTHGLEVIDAGGQKASPPTSWLNLNARPLSAAVDDAGAGWQHPPWQRRRRVGRGRLWLSTPPGASARSGTGRSNGTSLSRSKGLSACVCSISTG